MPKKRLPHLQKDINRHGTLVWYVRPNRGLRIRIRGDYGSAEFMENYYAAIAGKPLPGADMRISLKKPKMPSPDTKGNIYFVKAGAYVKIGFATNVPD